MFKEQYFLLNEAVKPDNELIERTLDRVKKGNKWYYTLRKPIGILTAMCLCVFLLTPALAANVEPIYQIMYRISPSAAQFFMPVEKSDEYDGIKMEVVSAYIHGDTAEIYVTMQDLTGGRIDSTTDLFDSYSINRPFDSSAHCSRVGYDKETKTAAFLIKITEWGNKRIKGSKITFSVREFISDKKAYEDILIPVNLSAVTETSQVQYVDSRGGWGANYEEYLENSVNPRALIPAEPIKGFEVEGIDLTAINYFEDRLHVQIGVENPLENDNHGFFYLKDSGGNVINSNYTISFVHPEKPISYDESVFGIPQKDMANYTLHGNFYTSGVNVKGRWQVTFPLEAE